MQQVGAESLGDLAFYFSSFQEALDNAGRAVADAWLSARQNVQVGLAGQVRALYRADARAAGQAAASGPFAPSGAGAGAPVQEPARRAAKFERPEAEEVDSQLVDTTATVLREASRYRTTDATRFKHLVDIARSVAAKAEKATLRRAATIWRELRAAAAKRGAPVHTTASAQLNRRRRFCQDCVRWLPASERAALPWQVGTF